MSTADRTWNVGVAAGAHWWQLPVTRDEDLPAPPEDPLEAEAVGQEAHQRAGTSAQRQVEDVVARMDGVGDPVAMTRAVLAFAQRAYESSAIAAAVVAVPEHATVRAYLELVLLPAGAGGMATDIEELKEQAYPATATWSEVDRVELPVGDAVRVHLIDAGPWGPGPSAVVESVWFLVPSPDRTGVLSLGMSWDDVTEPEPFLAEADALAQTLRFD